MTHFRAVSLAGAFVFCLLSAGCAGHVKTEISNTDGAGLAGAAEKSYRVAAVPGSENDANYVLLKRLLDEHLQRLGYAPAGEKNSRYLVQLAYSIRPPKVGSYAAEPPASKDAGEWLARPDGSKSVYSVDIHVAEQDSGREIYQVTASERHDDGNFAAAAPHLLDGALKEFPYGGAGTRILERPKDR